MRAPLNTKDGINALVVELSTRALELLANARLIAAAPDLIAALRQIVIEATESPNSDAKRVEIILEQARAALAKAGAA